VLVGSAAAPYSFGRARPASRLPVGIDRSNAPPATPAVGIAPVGSRSHSRRTTNNAAPDPPCRAVDIPSDAPTHRNSLTKQPHHRRAPWPRSGHGGKPVRWLGNLRVLATMPNHSPSTIPGVPGLDRAIRHPAAGHPRVPRRATVPTPPGHCRARPRPRGASGRHRKTRTRRVRDVAVPCLSGDTWTAKGFSSSAFSPARSTN